MNVTRWFVQRLSSRLEKTDARIWWVIGLCLFLILGDVNHRFLRYGEHTLERTQRETPVLVGILTLDDAIHENYLEKLSEFVSPGEIDRNVADALGTSLSASFSQEEGAWQSNGISYRLVGIFKSEGQFGVIDRVERLSNERSIIKVRLGTKIDDLEVVDVSMQFVMLRSESGEEIFLRLFDKEEQPGV